MHEDGLSWRPRWIAVLLAIWIAGCSSQPEPPRPTGSSSECAVEPANAKDKTSTPKPTGEPAELFAGWPKPQTVLIITGNQYGYLEPCGCTGLANQKGGLARRHSLIKQLVAKGWDVAPLDAGNQVRRFGPQAELQFQITADALKKMGYKAIGLGHDDLSLGELISSIAPDADGPPGPFTSANVAVADRSLLPRHLIVEAGGRKIGVAAVLGDDLRKKAADPDMLQDSVDDGLKEVLPEFDKATCDFRVLLAFTDEDDAKEIAKRHPVFNLVVASSSSAEPLPRPEAIEKTKSSLVHTGPKGMFAIVIGLYGDREEPKIRYERVPLDDRFPDSKEMRELMAGYQQQLKQQGLEELGVKPLPHPRGKFVGTATCGECHTKALTVWEKSKHAHATDSLIHPGERGDIPRHFDPECLSCHVTGWEPQKFLPFESGYLSVEKTPELMQNGCENCHGPGAEHVAAEGGADGALQEKLRTAMRLPLADKVAERKCMECHDIDNSPDFHEPGAFEKYWKDVEHKGKD
jgi:hypothetical protein